MRSEDFRSSTNQFFDYQTGQYLFRANIWNKNGHSSKTFASHEQAIAWINQKELESKSL